MYVDGNNKNLEIHVRMSQFIGAGTAISAVVLKETGVGTIQINYKSSGNQFRLRRHVSTYVCFRDFFEE